MSEPRKRKNRGAQSDTPEGPSKQDYAVAKYLRDKCPKKQTLLMNQKVYYFTGSKAVDTLLDSKWTKGSKKEAALFSGRDSIIDYLNRLRDFELFARAQKIVVKKVESKKEKEASKEKNKDKDTAGKDKKTDDGAEGDKGPKKRKNAKEAKKDQTQSTKEEKTSASEAEPESPKTDAKDTDKKKKKIRLELHRDQVFLDSNEAYVWIYEPTSITNILLGTGIVIGAIGICLFPLWPPIVRQGVYYLSLVAAGLLGLLIAASLLRYVAFAIVWAATMGKFHFWYLPNLTEDCGFFESFVPLYTCTRAAKDEKDKSSKKGSKKSSKVKEKGSDKEKEEDDANVDNDNDEETLEGKKAVNGDVEVES